MKPNEPIFSNNLDFLQPCWTVLSIDPQSYKLVHWWIYCSLRMSPFVSKWKSIEKKQDLGNTLGLTKKISNAVNE